MARRQLFGIYAMISEPNALDTLANLGEEIALYASYAIILIAPLVFWGMT